MSSRLEACLDEERVQAAVDRQDLLSQISLLVNKAGETQDARLESKISAVRTGMDASRSRFETEEKSYRNAMDVWSQKESLLVDEVLKARDTLKGRIKNDWTVSFHLIILVWASDTNLCPGYQRAQHCHPKNHQIRPRGNHPHR